MMKVMPYDPSHFTSGLHSFRCAIHSTLTNSI